MKEKLNDLVNKKWFHIVIMVIILAGINVCFRNNYFKI